MHLSLDQQPVELAVSADPGTIGFDREWALVILENALQSLQNQFTAEQQERQFSVLRQFLPGAIDPPAYETAAAQLGLSLPAFKSELHRLRRRFRAAVRQEVASTVSAPHEIDEEMVHLQQVLMDKGTVLAETGKPLPPVS